MNVTRNKLFYNMLLDFVSYCFSNDCFDFFFLIFSFVSMFSDIFYLPDLINIIFDIVNKILARTCISTVSYNLSIVISLYELFVFRIMFTVISRFGFKG